jgi:hypothetical protein
MFYIAKDVLDDRRKQKKMFTVDAATCNRKTPDAKEPIRGEHVSLGVLPGLYSGSAIHLDCDCFNISV